MSINICARLLANQCGLPSSFLPTDCLLRQIGVDHSTSTCEPDWWSKGSCRFWYATSNFYGKKSIWRSSWTITIREMRANSFPGQELQKIGFCHCLLHSVLYRRSCNTLLLSDKHSTQESQQKEPVFFPFQISVKQTTLYSLSSRHRRFCEWNTSGRRNKCLEAWWRCEISPLFDHRYWIG